MVRIFAPLQGRAEITSIGRLVIVIRLSRRSPVTHELQGSGWLGHTFVAYGMGNFLWWEHSYSTATGVLELTLHPNAPLTEHFIPAVVSSTGQPIVLTGPAARAAAGHYASLRTCTGLTARPT